MSDAAIAFTEPSSVKIGGSNGSRHVVRRAVTHWSKKSATWIRPIQMRFGPRGVHRAWRKSDGTATSVLLEVYLLAGLWDQCVSASPSAIWTQSRPLALAR